MISPNPNLYQTISVVMLPSPPGPGGLVTIYLYFSISSLTFSFGSSTLVMLTSWFMAART